MSKRALTIVLAMLMAIGVYSAVSNAGVEGDFTFDISIRPEIVQGKTMVEFNKFKFDFEGLLNLDITISGLTLSHDLAFGIAGIEHYIADFETTLGALDLKDEFAFAAPYATGTYYFNIVDHTIVPCDPTQETCLYKEVQVYRISDLQFVKKRVTAEITIGGLTFNNLIMFEDINFNHPYYEYIVSSPQPDVYGGDPPQTPSYKFGAIVTISGTTVSGITVTSKTGYNADWTAVVVSVPHPKLAVLLDLLDYTTNTIKKKTWYEAVVPEKIKEMVEIGGVPLAGLTLDSWYIAHMDTTAGTWDFETYFRVKYSLLDIVTAEAMLYSQDPLSLNFRWGAYKVATDFGSIYWYDLDGDLTMSSADLVVGVLDISIQNAGFSAVLATIPGLGPAMLILEADIPISYPEEIGTLEVTMDYLAGATGLEFHTVTFDLEKAFGEHNTFKIEAKFTKDILTKAGIEIGTTFSL